MVLVISLVLVLVLVLRARAQVLLARWLVPRGLQRLRAAIVQARAEQLA